jgi:hypothetical protein
MARKRRVHGRARHACWHFRTQGTDCAADEVEFPAGNASLIDKSGQNGLIPPTSRAVTFEVA